MNGTYRVSLKTPFGPQAGTVTLVEQNGALSGSIDALGAKNPFSGGTAQGNRFSFSGSLRTMVGRIDYTAEGVVEGDTITGTARTRFGIIRLSGRRVG